MAFMSTVSFVAAVALVLSTCLVGPSAASGVSIASSARLVDVRIPLVARSTSRTLKSSLQQERRGKEEDVPGRTFPISGFAAFWSLRGGFSAVGSDYEYDDDEESYEESIEDDKDGFDIPSEGEESADDDDDEGAALSDGDAFRSAPVKLIVQTGMNCPLIDQTLEVTASRTRTVASIRQTVSRQMRGRPPISAVRLLLANRLLQDDEVIDDLLPDSEESGEDEDGFDDDDDDEVDEMVKLRLTLDAVPPVDPKFGVDLGKEIQDLSTAELLEAWAANAAAAHENAEHVFAFDRHDENTADHELVESEEKEEEGGDTGASFSSTSVSMRRRAFSVKERIIETMPEAIELLDASENEEDEGGRSVAAINDMRRNRKGSAMKGGASTHVKRVIQRNLNINWSDTTRNFVLFLFFGYFGGRDAFSRTIMYLGAPLCFVLQARPVKIALKQLFYTIGEPPAILLSLLPAPQQTIMSLNYDSALAELYGEEGNPLGATEEFEADAYDIISEDGDSDPYDDSYDDY
mmetsp:Transcript_1278/g.2666  ORF Transcript_1278/g.2666 Transcript_1278/m.2666 type:complete len:520 (-) Transcript_1278:154-1713(-)|eukprot:CAMPEP_0178519172 /NCGR_PEP_ID=MMETSP0696-20121128/26681_1 /TAXON_ID=265572 /ORGANISM="Extubocellulus spinifer, Strain CCMP396" /LENGTH=519 /DNA_ID=CAMNT_0020149849 /DNA_START=36 /DNA_END=1595 /DNA_ORIENTATION=-